MKTYAELEVENLMLKQRLSEAEILLARYADCDFEGFIPNLYIVARNFLERSTLKNSQFSEVKTEKGAERL